MSPISSRTSTLHYMEAQTWAVPHEPRVPGFTFLYWQILPGNLNDGIVLQAVYQANTQTPNPSDIIVNLCIYQKNLLYFCGRF